MHNKMTMRMILGALIGASLGLAACVDSGTDDGDSSNNANNDPDANVTIVQSDLERDTSPQVDANDLAAQVAGNTAFAIDLYKELLGANAGKDIVASPYSISIALAMTYAGARGQTEMDMASVMHYDLLSDKLHPAFNYLDLALESRGEGSEAQDGEPFRLKVANSIWGQEGFPFKDPFLDTLAVNYGAGLRVLDFVEETEPSRITINDWVEDKTEGRIKDLLPEGVITTDTRLVLTNAIYFNAAWELKFEEGATRDGDFTLLDGSSASVPMMHQLESFPYAKVGDVDAIELMYDGGEVSMVILVPQDFDAFESTTLSPQLLEDIDGAMSTKLVELAMPKFEVESTIGLSETLQSMGMSSAFFGADFTGIADADLAITDVLHKAFINLDESGTEAAAATAVVVGETSVPVVDVTLEIDRPFFYVIRDVETKTVIFMGRILDPR